MHHISRAIRSFVHREKRSEKRSIPNDLWERYSIHVGKAIKLSDHFNQSVLTLDIGFGTGDSLFQQAKFNVNQGYLGIEVYKTGILKLLNQLSNSPLDNIKFIKEDAYTILSEYILPNSLDNIQILFPDPWPKSKHHKRRLIQPDFVQLLHTALKKHGKLYLATDWQHYAEHMLQTIDNSLFTNEAGDLQFAERPHIIPITKFEKRGKNLGHDLFYLVFSKCH
jgi:tRNA (guanine-N7-)-methyltransferase